jgi:hypothetical protein
MSKKTLAQICVANGISRDVLDAAKTAGVNVWNAEELAQHLGKRRHRVAKDAKLTVAPVVPDDDMPEDPHEAIRRIESDIRKTQDHNDVKILADKLKALLVGVKIREEMGDLIPVGQVREAATRVCSAARSELLKLAADSAPKLEGLPAAKIQAILRSDISDILTRLSDETSSLYD